MTQETDDWREEAYAAFVKGLADREALDRRRRSERGEFTIELAGAGDEPSVSAKGFQADLRAVTGRLREAEVAFTQTFVAMDSLDTQGYSLPELVMAVKVLTPAAMPAIGVVLGAWLTSRNGRKVRLKIGDVEAEATTVAEVEQLIKTAAEHRPKDLG